MKYYYCNKPSHLQAECRKKWADKNNGVVKPKKEFSNQAEVELELFVAIEEVCNEAQASSSHDNSWILDSGASRHMTSHKE